MLGKNGRIEIKKQSQAATANERRLRFEPGKHGPTVTITILCWPLPNSGDSLGSMLTYWSRKLGSNSGFDKHQCSQDHLLKPTVGHTHDFGVL